LDTVTVTLDAPSEVVVYDADGRPYARQTGAGMDVVVSGAIGTHVVARYDADGTEVERATFEVDCVSEVLDPAGRYERLLLYLKKSMFDDFSRPNNVRRLDGRVQRSFVLTSRDHVHGMKAMKYFHSIIPTWMDTFADHQAEDGMIWDFCGVRNKRMTHFENRWGEKFHKVVDNGWTVFARQPMMNDVEYMFIHGVWAVWKTLGDDEWMSRRVDNALRALRYATSSPYTWSEKYRLVKRTFTIDLWDFQSEFDAALVGGDAMQAIPGVSQYGVMFGDNLGIALGCDYIAEMLGHLGRRDEADDVARIGMGIRERLDELSWNGEFFTMFVGEDPTFERDFGVDTDRQVTLSNAYALNRGISHEQAVAIIRTYQRLREETAEFAPAEWTCCYPPFPRGFGHHSQWHYVNGGVSPMVAGELAHGAFEHGFEAYGWDILDRVLALGDRYDQVPRVWRGRMGDEPERTFTPLDLRPHANTDFCGTVDSDAIPWTNEGDNDLHEMPVGPQKLAGVDFDVIDPAVNDRKACVGISRNEPYLPELTVPVGRKAASIYLLHTVSGKSAVAGELTLRYADGGEVSQYVQKGKHISGWWMPRPAEVKGNWDPKMVVAWMGANAHTKEVGVVAWGLDNPQPDREVEAIILRPGIEAGTTWLVLGVTLCDAPVWFEPSGLSAGIPAPWSCGAVVYALMEGLAGVYDEAQDYRAVRVAPRWAAGSDNDVTVCAKYEDTGSYVRYAWRRDADRIDLDLASSAADRRIELLMPQGARAACVSLDGEAVDFETRRIEQSTYVCFDAPGLAARRVEVELT
jgi:hypothetical protein